MDLSAHSIAISQQQNELQKSMDEYWIIYFEFLMCHWKNQEEIWEYFKA